MGIEQILGIIQVIVFILVGCALIWFLIELVRMVKSARTTVDDMREQLDPTLKNVQKITEQVDPLLVKVNGIVDEIQPAVGKVDPIVDRVALTVDAANLEIMRVDQILEDVTQITGSVSKTLDTVDSVTSAPLDLVNSLTAKVRTKMKPRYASDQSVKLGESEETKKSAVGDFVDAAADAAGAVVDQQRTRMRDRKAQRASRQEASAEWESGLDDTASVIDGAAFDAIHRDTPAADGDSTYRPGNGEVTFTTAEGAVHAAEDSDYLDGGAARFEPYGEHRQ